MSLRNRFKPAPKIRPMLNVGCLFDIPTGSYRLGKHGESILNGGLSPITGIGGRGNTYKSTIAHFKILRALDRHRGSSAVVYDTEESLSVERLVQLSSWMKNVNEQDLDDEGRIILAAKQSMKGNEFFEEFRNEMRERKKEEEKVKKTTPFVDKSGDLIKAFPPFLTEVDSFSQMDIEALEKLYDAHGMGESGLNVEALKSAAAKSQMMMQLPGVTNTAGGYIILTAHVGDEHQLDPYAPPAKKLSFLKGKVKFKRVPENFTFLTNNCWYCLSANVLVNDRTKAPEFPRNSDDDLKGDTDLMKITLQNLRGKSGPTGMPITIIASQSEGVHVGLTEFYFLKTEGNRFGLGGHDKSYYLELVPDIKMQRTTVRNKIDSNPCVKRALEITSEMCQIKQLWHHIDEDLMVDPKELYEGLKAKGYDWEKLLDTRGYWMFEEDVTDDDKPFLSTMDLLKMHKGEYHPWWYPKSELSATKTESAPAKSEESSA